MNNIGFEILFPKVKLNKHQDADEIDGVEFLLRNLSKEDFKRFAEIVRGFFWEMGWGGCLPDYYSTSPDEGKPPREKRRRRKRRRQQRGHRRGGEP